MVGRESRYLGHRRFGLQAGRDHDRATKHPLWRHPVPPDNRYRSKEAKFLEARGLWRGVPVGPRFA